MGVRKSKRLLTVVVLIALLISCGWYYSTHRTYAIIGYYNKNAGIIKSKNNHFKATGELGVLFHYKEPKGPVTLSLLLWKEEQQKPLENSVIIQDRPYVHNGWADLRTHIAQAKDLRLNPGKYHIYLYNKREQISSATFIVDNTFSALNKTLNIRVTKATSVPSPIFTLSQLSDIIVFLVLVVVSALIFEVISLFRNRNKKGDK
jgi:hypothetical protein